MTYDRTKLKVYKTACDQCLFSSNKIVSDNRKAEVLAEIKSKQTFFVCHKSSIEDPAEGIMCRGFYEANKTTSLLILLGHAAGVVVFKDQPTKKDK